MAFQIYLYTLKDFFPFPQNSCHTSQSEVGATYVTFNKKYFSRRHSVWNLLLCNRKFLINLSIDILQLGCIYYFLVAKEMILKKIHSMIFSYAEHAIANGYANKRKICLETILLHLYAHVGKREIENYIT